MKLLAFTDVHGSLDAISILQKKAKEADLLVCAGDISEWGEGVERLIQHLGKTGKPLLIIPGNHENENVMGTLCRKFPFCYYIHKGSYEIDDYVFFGFGSGGFSEKDKDFERVAEKFRAAIGKGKKIILVTHGPPYGTKLDYLSGMGHRGSRSLRHFDEEVKPMLHICGHLHENSGNTDMIGNHTLVVNPGASGLIIEI